MTGKDAPPHDPWTRWFAAIAVTLLSLLLVLFTIAGTRGPSTMERLNNVENQLQVVTCLLLLPIEERVARGVAECQIRPEGNP